MSSNLELSRIPGYEKYAGGSGIPYETASCDKKNNIYPLIFLLVEVSSQIKHSILPLVS